MLLRATTLALVLAASAAHAQSYPVQVTPWSNGGGYTITQPWQAPVYVQPYAGGYLVQGQQGATTVMPNGPNTWIVTPPVMPLLGEQ